MDRRKLPYVQGSKPLVLTDALKQAMLPTEWAHLVAERARSGDIHALRLYAEYVQPREQTIRHIHAVLTERPLAELDDRELIEMIEPSAPKAIEGDTPTPP